MKNLKRQFIIITFFLYFLFVKTSIFAEEVNISVSENGQSSSNEVKLETSTSSSVNQENNAQASNNVVINQNTGGNDASSNSSDVSITTGGVNSTTNISNENINTNIGNSTDCSCVQNSVLEVSGNGEESHNLIEQTSTTNIQIGQQNNVNINNTVSANINTGNNQSSGNNGSVFITTGDVKVNSNIENSRINFTAGKFTSSQNSIKNVISGNGNNSNNNISLIENKNFIIDIRNISFITNNVDFLLNTGYNRSSENNGDVVIKSGDITSNINIENNDINTSFVRVSCPANQIIEDPDDPDDDESDDEEEDESDDDESSVEPSTTNSGNGGSDDDEGDDEEENDSDILGITDELPFTGSYLMLLATLVSLLLFFIGLCMRLRLILSPPSYRVA